MGMVMERGPDSRFPCGDATSARASGSEIDRRHKSERSQRCNCPYLYLGILLL